MSEKGKLVKKLSKSRFAAYEKKSKTENFAPVPEKYSAEDEALAKAAGGGLKAFELQQRRLAELEIEKVDEIVARKLSQTSDDTVSTNPYDAEEEERKSLEIIKLLQEEDSKVAVDEDPIEIKEATKTELSKLIKSLFDLQLGLNEQQFYQLVINEMNSISITKKQCPLASLFCADQVRKLFSEPSMANQSVATTDGGVSQCSINTVEAPNKKGSNQKVSPINNKPRKIFGMFSK